MATSTSATAPPHTRTTARAVAGLAALALWLGWVIPLLYRQVPVETPSWGVEQAVCSPTAARR